MRPDKLVIVTDQLIGGRLLPGQGGLLSVDDPSDGSELAAFPQATRSQVDDAVRAAEAAFDGWSTMTGAERSTCMHRFADALSARRQELIDLIVAEAGTPVTLTTHLQVDAPLTHLRWYAEMAARDWTQHLGIDETAPRSASVIAHRPVGPVAALTAYNYPLLLAVSKMGAAMSAGCTVVLMPSPLAPLATLLVGQAALDAGLPPGVLNVVVGGRDEAIALTQAPAIQKVSFTGSLGVGIQVMKQAADTMKGVTLELGGKSPNLLLPGVDLDEVTDPVHLRYLRNAGQGCASPTRILVHTDQYDEFVERSRRVFDSVAVGDPWSPETIVGPVISAGHRDRIESFVSAALDAGGTAVARGRAPDSQGGYWVAPALVGDVPSDADIAQQEIFGPVGVVLRYDDIDHAVRLANDTAYGLAANIYGDPDDARVLAARLRAGLVTINGGGALRPDGVFGGFKGSGIGREHGEWGIREFLEPQHVQWAL